MEARKCFNPLTGIILVCLAVLLFLISLIGFAVFPYIFHRVLKSEIPLVNNTMAFNMWKDIPLPIYEKMYFFNITNSDDFVTDLVKLKVAQVGPYVYKGRWAKENIRWFPNDTVNYRERRTYHFDRSQSSGPESDEIYTLNGPLIMAADYIKNYNVFEKAAAAAVLFGAFGERLIIKKKISELVYGGYEDPIIKYGKYIRSDLPFKGDKFCWLYGKNYTDDGAFTVFTGQDDLDQLNVINNWNGNPKLTYWKNDTCNMINGTSGEMNPPFKEGQTQISIFQSLLCRSVTFNHDGDASVLGISGKHFTLDRNVFANKSVKADNYCFDTKPYLASGVMDMSPCQYGVPAVMSKPHFCHADPSYLDNIIGLQPDDDVCHSVVTFEPNTGVPMDLTVKIQMNLEVFPIDDLIGYPVMRKGIYPVFWMELKVVLTEDLANLLYTKLIFSKIIANVLLGLIMGISILLGIGGVFILLKVNKKRDVPLLSTRDGINDYSSLGTDNMYSEQIIQNDAKRKNSYEKDNSDYAQRVVFTSSETLTDANVSINQSEDDVTLLDAGKLLLDSGKEKY